MDMTDFESGAIITTPRPFHNDMENTRKIHMYMIKASTVYMP